jgi:murein hydrolase activator
MVDHSLTMPPIASPRRLDEDRMDGRLTARRGLRLGAARLALAMAVSFMPAKLSAQNVDEIESRRAQTSRDYEEISREVTLSQERAAEIEAEIETIRQDNAAISAALIQAAKTERKLGEDIADIGSRLETLRAEELLLRQSLAARREVLAEVLGALQRMGLNPPPAILVTPEDALSSVRSSILLAAVVPELRSETEILMADLAQLSRIAASIEAERERLALTMGEQAEEQQKLSLLLEEKRRLQARSEEELLAEQARAEQLAADASGLRELIDALEADLEIAREAAEKARLAAAEAAAAEAARPPAEIAPLPGGVPFTAMAGQLSLPVSGRLSARFGQDDGAGGARMGDMVATHSGAIVTAPTDGAVLYAGPFRSYGQLLILDAGDGYHVVLAGMGRISVAPGQTLLAGEPVGVMGESRVASVAAIGGGSAGPELYVEFRKEGKPVDPAPWWAERVSGRTEDDS